MPKMQCSHFYTHTHTHTNSEQGRTSEEGDDPVDMTECNGSEKLRPTGTGGGCCKIISKWWKKDKK